MSNQIVYKLVKNKLLHQLIEILMVRISEVKQNKTKTGSNRLVTVRRMCIYIKNNVMVLVTHFSMLDK